MVKKCTFAADFLTTIIIKLMNDSELNVLYGKMIKGDKPSFDAIFRHYYPSLVRYCLRYVGDTDVAAEIVQDLFVKIWTGRSRLNITSSFDSYIVRSVRNGALTYINKVKLHDEVHQNLVTVDVESNDPSEELQSKNLEHSYQQVLAAMPEKRREVFLASRFDGLKYAEIADKMGISLKTVETHMSAAIKQLKDGLKDYI